MKNTQVSLGSRHAQHSFAQVPSARIGRSKFDRSHAAKTTMDFDYLVPVLIDDVLPGDTFNLNIKSFIRLATQTTPVLDNMKVDFFSFFVPTRLVWTNWEKLNGAQDNPGDSTDYTMPTITVNNGTGIAVGSLYDQLGLPTEVDDITFRNDIGRSYNLIYNEWFRDQNLINSVTVDTDDGPDDIADYVLLKRAKKHDYFTSALPWPQKGDAVSLPLGTTAPVESDGNAIEFKAISGDTWTGKILEGTPGNSGTNNYVDIRDSGSSSGWATVGYDDAGLQVNLATATSATIDQLIESMQIQALLRKDARGGTRYVEIIKSHFNVTSPDFRLQRPEFLSGGSISINQHPVPQTSESGTTDQASLAAFSTATHLGQNIGFSKSFTEHGIVMVLACAKADITYQQGINRMWSRSERYDFFWPELQQLGEQAILNKEIYAQGSTVDTGSTGTPDDERVFGYIPRYDEYRYKPSEIRGQFRSTYATSLDVWHIAEEFSSLPSLNQTFIEQNTPIERSLAVAASYPHLLCDFWFDYKCVRPMMTYGIPASLGRF
jgi:hypothetical protein